VELAMAYKCEVSQEKLLQYIHFNRQYNTLLIEHNTKLIDQLRTEVILVRKPGGNPEDFFDKTFAEYKAGFAANGLLKHQYGIKMIFKERAGLALRISTD